jgi:hypothetical protein
MVGKTLLVATAQKDCNPRFDAEDVWWLAQTGCAERSLNLFGLFNTMHVDLSSPEWGDLELEATITVSRRQ